MPRAIIIPLYDHTSDEEIADMLDSLRRIGVDDSFVGKHEYTAAEIVADPHRHSCRV